MRMIDALSDADVTRAEEKRMGGPHGDRQEGLKKTIAYFNEFLRRHARQAVPQNLNAISSTRWITWNNEHYHAAGRQP